MNLCNFSLIVVIYICDQLESSLKSVNSREILTAKLMRPAELSIDICNSFCSFIFKNLFNAQCLLQVFDSFGIFRLVCVYTLQGYVQIRLSWSVF